MDYPGISGFTEEAEKFLDQWYDSSDYISAYTSGSTGVPKEIRLLKSDMVVSAKATNVFFGITSSSALALPLSISYIAGKMMVVRSLVAGCNLYISKPSIDPLRNLPDNIKYSLLPIVPAQIPGLLSRRNLNQIVANIIVGGAPTTPVQDKQLAETGIPVYATYGMTETASHVALRRIGKEDFYNALPGIEFDIDDRSCLVIESALSSYRKITTNDCVSLISPTRFRWLGRVDNVINTGGIKVFPETIEKKLSPILGDRTYYISSRPSEKWGNEIILYVEGGNLDKERFLVNASEILDKKFLPKEIICVEAFDRTDSGKIIRK